MASAAAIRKLLFTPCTNKVHFQLWIKQFLNIELPDCTVVEESNSNPLDAAWEYYDRMVRNDLVGLSRVMTYAGRGGMKTLSASILETMVLLHTKRNIGHMAAIEAQARKSALYIRDFFRLPYLRDFIVGDNARQITVVRFLHNKTGDIVTELEWNDFLEVDKKKYTRLENYIKLVVCTLAAANGDHVEFFCVDGDTKILTKTSVQGRERKQYTARGIFRRLAGLDPGGAIGELEEKDIPKPFDKIEVLTVNPNTFQLEFKPILRAHQKRAATVRIETESGKKIVTTKDHPFRIFQKGFVMAGDLKVGQNLLLLGKTQTSSAKQNTLTKFENAVFEKYQDDGQYDEWEQVAMGSALGDAGVYRGPKNNAYLQEQHCIEQSEYLNWKRIAISNKVRTIDTSPKSGYTGDDQVGFRTGCSPLLNWLVPLRHEFIGIEKLGPLGLAIWYQDDGCAGRGFRLSTEGWDKEKNEFLKYFLLRKFGLRVSVSSYTRDGKTFFYLTGGVEAKRRLVDICEPFIHPTMAYKFDLTANWSNCQYCGDKYWFYERGKTAKDCGKPECRAVYKKILKIDKIKDVTEVGERWVYDFTVADNHNFFAEGLLVKNCVDEIDVVPKQNIQAYYQASNIPDPRDGMLPLTMLTSTRKSRVGLVQKEIDESDRTGLKVVHWNLIDITQKCEPERHQPELPKETYYVNDDLLKHLPVEEYAVLNPGQQKKYYPVEGFAGCKSCKLFSACKGRLATHQKSTSPMLKPISFSINKFQSAPNPEFIQTEHLCRKPDTTGLVYPRLAPEIHCKTASEIMELVTGEKSQEVTKGQLIAALKNKNARFGGGMDFGFSHNFAVTTFANYGPYVFVLDCYSQSGLELEEQISNSQYLKEVYGNPPVWADPAYPGSIKSFHRKGFKMRDWDKKPHSVKAGIEIVRALMWSGSGATRLYFLKDDPGVDYLVKRLMQYSFTVDATGVPTEEPNKENDDEADSLRYGLMNAMGSQDALKDTTGTTTTEQGQVTKTNWLQDIINKEVGEGTQDVQNPTIQVKRGKFIWNG